MKCNYIPTVASISMVIGVCLGFFLGITLFGETEKGEIVFGPQMRHGYQKEELLAELENVTGGVRLYSDQAGNLYMVYGSTTIPDASYRIEKRSWVKQ